MSSADKFSKLFDTQKVFLKEYLEKVDFKKVNRGQKHMQNYTVWKKFTHV